MLPEKPFQIFVGLDENFEIKTCIRTAFSDCSLKSNKFYSVERKLRHPILKFNHAYCLTLNRACCCHLCYLMSSFLCALPQHIVCCCTWGQTHVIPTADNHTSISAVFQLGGLCIFLQFQFQIFDNDRLFFNFYFFPIFSEFLNSSKYLIFSNFRVEIL